MSFRVTSCIFILLFISPYFLLILNVEASWSATTEFLDVSVRNFFHAIVSAILAIAFGLFGALGHSWVSKKRNNLLKITVLSFTLSPIVLPTLFLVISLMSITSKYPLNMSGVIILHVIQYLGVSSFFCYKMLALKGGSYSELCRLKGVSYARFLQSTFSLFSKDLVLIFISLFVTFYTSYTAPVLIASSQGISVEALVYRLIIGDGTMNVASYFVILQFLLIVFLTLVFSYFGRSEVKKDLTVDLSYSSSNYLWLSLIAPLVLLYGSTTSLLRILRLENIEWEVFDNLVVYLLNTLIVGLISGVLCWAALFCMLRMIRVKSINRFLSFYQVPCYIGISLAFLTFSNGSQGLFVVSIALVFVSLPGLTRFGYLQYYNSLSEQLETAKLLGGGRAYIDKKILTPQMMPTIYMLSGICALWCMSDFALSRIFFGRNRTLAMWIESLVQQYRWHYASAGSLLLLLPMLFVFGLFMWGAYVSDQKLS